MINVKRFLHELVHGKPRDVPSPGHRVLNSQISWTDYEVGGARYKDWKIRGLPMQTAWLPNPHDTDSMDGPGLIDVDANLLLSWSPDDIDSVDLGDIIAWRLPSGVARMHRIVEIGEDQAGWYCRTKGDNLVFIDPQKVRKDNITYVVLGIVF